MTRRQPWELETLNGGKQLFCTLLGLRWGLGLVLGFRELNILQVQERCGKNLVLQVGTHKLQKQPPFTGLQQGVSTILNSTACGWTRTKLLHLCCHSVFCFPNTLPFHRSLWTSSPWAVHIVKHYYCKKKNETLFKVVKSTQRITLPFLCQHLCSWTCRLFESLNPNPK